MNDTIIITDLTRLGRDGKVCLASYYSQQQRKVIRPLFSEQMKDAYYIDQEVCEQYNILLVIRLCGDFESMNHSSPHNEDHLVRGDFHALEPATKKELLSVLQTTNCGTLTSGTPPFTNSQEFSQV